MDDLEQQEPTSHVGPVLIAIIASLSFGLTAGRIWEYEKNKTCFELGQDFISTGKDMIKAASFTEGYTNLHKDEQLLTDDSGGILYIRIGYIREPVSKDVNNPETDGHKPSTEEADKWANEKETK